MSLVRKESTTSLTKFGNGVFVWRVKVNYGTGRRDLYISAQTAAQAVAGVCEAIDSVQPQHVYSVKLLGCAVGVIVDYANQNPKEAT